MKLNTRTANSFRKEQSTLLRCRYWQLVISDPAAIYPDAGTHPYVAARYRRDAQRNLSKLLRKYPDVAERLERENPGEIKPE